MLEPAFLPVLAELIQHLTSGQSLFLSLKHNGILKKKTKNRI